MTHPSPEVAQALAAVDTALTRLKTVLAGPPSAGGGIALTVARATADSVTVAWVTDRTDLGGPWTIGRDGTDARGSGPWSTQLTAALRGEFTFSSLRPGTAYRLTLAPAVGEPVTVQATTSTAPGPGPQPGPGPGQLHGPRALADGWVPLLVAGDDFNGAAVDAGQWNRYLDPTSQHGNRQPGQFSIVDDPTALGGRALRVQGTTDGRTGGMSHELGQRFGRWAARMRIPDGDPRWHPVLLTWPDDEKRFPWPNGGEIDYAEGKCGTDRMEFFLHYGRDNRQTSGRIDVDVSAWHWYEMEWAPDAVRGWCDGRLYFEDRDRTHFNYPGFNAHHGTIQLDWFPGGAKQTGVGEMLVDAYRVYAHPDTVRAD